MALRLVTVLMQGVCPAVAISAWAAVQEAAPAQPSSSSNRLSQVTRPHHVVLVVWDGMRPDFVTEQNCPTLYRLARQGVTFTHHHSVFPSSTEVNGTALFTGGYPAHDGITGNNEYRPEIDPLKPFHTETLAAVRKGDELTHGHYLRLLTVAEIVRQAGLRAVEAGAKPIALLADRLPRTSADSGATLFADAAVPETLLEAITNRQGAFVKDNPAKATRNDWTTAALLDSLWAPGVPALSLLWMDEPDFSQHQSGPGSRRSLAAIRNADDNLAKVLRAIEAKGERDTTDIMVVSDHGFSTVSTRADLADALTKAGLKAAREFKTKPARGDMLVVSNGGSTTVYVIGHDQQVIQQAVRFLQGWKYTGVIFTRKARPGTFGLSQAHLDSDPAPDIVVSLRWTPDQNKNGTPGMVVADVSGFGPGQGAHASLSPFDMHNTLVAAGPDFRSSAVDDLPTGNVDIAPTLLWILGLKPPKAMDGRVLTEALAIPGPKVAASPPRRVEAASEQNGGVWHQYLKFSEVNSVVYYDEGNGHQANK